MAHTIVTLEKNGMIKLAPLGFSWTNLLFIWFLPFYREDYIWGSVQAVFWVFSGGISGFLFPFFYNRVHLKSLINSGWEPVATTKGNLKEIISQL